MATAIPTLDTLAAEFKADFAVVNTANDNLGKAESTMTAIALKAARHTLPNGPMPRLAGDPALVGKWVYGQSGKSPVTDGSFAAQSSKIAKVIKAAQRWDNQGMAAVEIAADAVGNGYNKLLSLISTINRLTKDGKAPPSAAEIKAWAEKAPKAEKTDATLADVLDECITALGEAAAKLEKPDARIEKAMRELVEATKTAGMTTAEMKAAKLTANRSKTYADLLASARKKAA